MSSRFSICTCIVGGLLVAGTNLGCSDSPARPSVQPAGLSIAFVTPNIGLANGDTAIRIAGTGFQSGTTLAIDGQATPVVFVDSTALTATARAHPVGPVDIAVTNPGGQTARLAGGFTYYLPVTAFAISGNTALASVGETSQLSATATLSDGSTQDVTARVQWSSSVATVLSVTPGGLVTARALGLAWVMARYQPVGLGAPMYRSVYVTVTPPGTFVVAGRAREPGAGSLSGVRAVHLPTGQEVMTGSDGGFSFGGLTGSSRFSFTKAGYEDVEVELGPNVYGDVPLQQIVRIAAGASVSPMLAPNDVDYLVTATAHCQPCRRIRVTTSTSGTLELRVTWTVSHSVLNIWVNGLAFLSGAGAREVVAEVPVGAGEVVLYVGKIPAPVGDYVPFVLATAMK